MESFVQSLSLASTVWVYNLVKASGTLASVTEGMSLVPENLVPDMASGQDRHEQIAAWQSRLSTWISNESITWNVRMWEVGKGGGFDCLSWHFTGAPGIETLLPYAGSSPDDNTLTYLKSSTKHPRKEKKLEICIMNVEGVGLICFLFCHDIVMVGWAAKQFW